MLDVLASGEQRRLVRAGHHVNAIVHQRIRHALGLVVFDPTAIRRRVLPVLAQQGRQTNLPAFLRRLLTIGVGVVVEDLRQILHVHPSRVREHPEGAVHDTLSTEVRAGRQLESIAALAIPPKRRLPACQRSVSARRVLDHPNSAQGTAETPRLTSLFRLQVLNLLPALAPESPALRRILEHRHGLGLAGCREAVRLPRPTLQVARLLSGGPRLPARRWCLAWEAWPWKISVSADRLLLRTPCWARDCALCERGDQSSPGAPEPTLLVDHPVAEVLASRRGGTPCLAHHGRGLEEGHAGDVRERRRVHIAIVVATHGHIRQRVVQLKGCSLATADSCRQGHKSLRQLSPPVGPATTAAPSGSNRRHRDSPAPSRH
mmetsp:Transcript_15831/g.45720  ORF Transcript_15831/g.45720 Transcript_15831/m.45720 type:complete len:375 (+) Transcript_15831:678-1802(+)